MSISLPNILPNTLLSLSFPSDVQLSAQGDAVAFVLSSVVPSGSSNRPNTKTEQTEHTALRYHSNIWLSRRSALSQEPKTQQLTFGERKDWSPLWSPDGSWLAFLRDTAEYKGQLYLLPLAGGEAQQVTHFKNSVSAVQWSPCGRFLSFLSLGNAEDKRKERGEARVITSPVYRFNERNWLPQHPACLWHYELSTQTLSEWYAPSIEIMAYTWKTDSTGLWLVSSETDLAAAKEQNNIYQLDFLGHYQLYLAWQNTIENLIPHPDGKSLALLGKPMGGNNLKPNLFLAHLFLIDAQKNWQHLDAAHDYPVGNLVSGDCHVGQFPQQPVWLDTDTLLFSSTVGGSCGLFSVSLNVSLAAKVSAYDHHPKQVITGFSANQYGVAVIREGADLFPEVEWNGAPLTELRAQLPFAVQVPHIVHFENELGRGEGWVLLPPNLNQVNLNQVNLNQVNTDQTAPVPALLSIHGGPHTAYGHTFMHEFQVLAASGYGVCYSNPRGSVGYGQAWVEDIYGRWGSVDQADLLNFFDVCLAQFSELDSQKTGVLGGSYGGYMTNWITGHTDRFKVAITDRSICNLISFNGTSDIGLRFWNTELGLSFNKQADALKLWDLSPLKYVENVKTPTLIVHSEQDHRCPIEQAEQWYAALTLGGVPTRFVRFPTENHELSRSGRPDRRIQRLNEYLAWLERWL